jgi:hypothetical protein
VFPVNSASIRVYSPAKTVAEAQSGVSPARFGRHAFASIAIQTSNGFWVVRAWKRSAEDTDHRAGHETARFGKAVMLGQNRARKSVDAACNALDDAAFTESFQLAAGDASLLELAGVGEASLPKKRYCSL